MDWTAIVLTCPSSSYTSPLQKELEKRKAFGFINKETILLVVEDPKFRIGSGGATLNALLVLAEHISAKRGYAVVSPDVLLDARILIIHFGRTNPYEPCGRPFVVLPIADRSFSKIFPHGICLLDYIINLMTTKVALNSPPGVWVCSSDMVLTVEVVIKSDILKGCDACLVMVPSDVEYAKDHGICELDKEGQVLQNIHYKCKQSDVIHKCKLSNGQVPLVSGIVYLSTHVANSLLLLHTISPLDACTYLGYDSGIMPIQLSLFFDFLLAMCPGYAKTKFINGGIFRHSSENIGDNACRSDRSKAQNLPDFTTLARSIVYKNFSQFKCRAVLTNGSHSYLTWSGCEYKSQVMSMPLKLSLVNEKLWKFDSKCHSFIEDSIEIRDNVGLLNCCLLGNIKIGRGSLLQNSFFNGNFVVGESCIINCVNMEKATNFHLQNNTSMVGFCVRSGKLKQRCIVIFGCQDDIMNSLTFFNIPVEEYKSKTGITDEDLWKDQEVKSIFNANLFPVLPIIQDEDEEKGERDDDDDTVFVEFLNFLQNIETDSDTLSRWRQCKRTSLKEIFENFDVESQFELKRNIFHSISLRIIERVLANNQPTELRSLYKAAYMDGKCQLIFKKLDSMGVSYQHCPGITARVLANIGELLGEMSHGEGGLRSGPASNQEWKEAFMLLENFQIAAGFKRLAMERKNWMNTNCRLVRAARHYEGAGQILIRQAVMTVQKFIKTANCNLPDIDQWVECCCPARIDISGGWSDTPPITYESGGAVFNAAITVNGLKPIGAKIKRIPSFELIIHLENGITIQGNNLDFFRNHNQPSAAGSLIKACFICSGLVEYPSQESLHDQLARKYNSGFEIHSWSNLPHGSGLGTSSILAGAVIACMWRAAGHSFDIHSLNHVVLYVEQQLTTGGGWQDQVGGLCGGVKLGQSKLGLPLEIDVTTVSTTNEIVSSFNSRLILVYTGQTRLAKNLLQNVVRNWYSRDDEIMKIIHGLVQLAHNSCQAFQNGDFMKLGRNISEYWELKKALAPESEPRAVSLMMAALRDRCYGICMAGAGGGGFMYLLTKEPHDGVNVQKILNQIKNIGQPEVYEACIDETGITLQLDGCKIENIPYKM